MKVKYWKGLGLALGFTILTGCQSNPTRGIIDQEFEQIVKEKWPADASDTIEYILSDSFSKPDEQQIQELLAQNHGVLSIQQALDFAISYNREYQEQKELLYFQFLDLNRVRFHLRSQFLPPRKTSLDPVLDPTKDVMTTSSFATVTNTTELADAWAIALTGPLQQGAFSLFRSELGDPLPNQVQRDMQAKEKVQAERDMIESIRLFKRYQKTFAVAVLTSYCGYYRVLQLKEVVKLTQEKYEFLQNAYQRMQKLAEAGYVLRFQLDQILHDQILAKDDLLKARRDYNNLLDEFKLLIGIPVHVQFQLDEKELVLLRTEKLQEPKFSLELGIQSALRSRLDLANQLDDISDIARALLRKAYNPNTRLEFIKKSRSIPENDPILSVLRYLIYDLKQEFPQNLPFDRLIERNNFRQDLVELAEKKRDYEHTIETIKLEVRRAHRRLLLAGERYINQKEAIKLAEQRLESTMKLLQNGLATISDVHQAQEDLYDAKIDALDALIDHNDATLQLYRDTGLLQVKPNGQWEVAEIPN